VAIDVVTTSSRIEGIKKHMFYLKKIIFCFLGQEKLINVIFYM